MTTLKAQSIARQLNEDLGLRLSTLGTATGTDTNGEPTILVGTGTAGTQSAFIRVMEQASILTDSLGLAQRVYTPHVIQVVVESSSTAGETLASLANLTLLLGDTLKHGTRVEVYMSANGTGPSVAGITANNLKVVYDHLWHPLTSTM